MNRPKKQGTAFETFLVDRFGDVGCIARRLAEQGTSDVGDIEIIDAGGDTWVIEARHREKMGVHTALEKARKKALKHGSMVDVALIWKRSQQQGENTRRTPVAVGTVVVLDLPTFLSLVGQEDLRPTR